MKSIRRALYIMFGVLSVTPFIVNAQFSMPSKNDIGLSDVTVHDLILNVMNWLLGLIGVLGVIAFVIAGVMYLTSAGDEEQAAKGKSIMLYAIIGLVIALLGLVIVNAVAGLTGAGNVSNY